MNLKREVEGKGPLGGMLIIGEAPGDQEIREKVPFVGHSGRVLREHLKNANIDPRDVRFENVLERKLVPQGSGDAVAVMYHDSRRSLPNSELQEWHADIRRRIKLIKPKVIVAAGDTAMRALLPYSSLAKCHCYVIDVPDIGMIVPTYHPDYVVKMPEAGHWLELGLKKAKRVMAGQKDPVLSLTVNPTEDEILKMLSNASNSELISIDIEKTMTDHRLTCLAVAVSETEAISIPASSLTPPVHAALKALFMNSKIAKLFQNFIFDTMFLHHIGLPINGTLYDTMLAAHCLEPELPKSLADLARLYCFCKPWKSKFDWADANTDLQIYNARDAARTYQIWEAQRVELKANNLEKFFTRRYVDLAQFVLPMCLRGIRIDLEAFEKFKEEIKIVTGDLNKTLVDLGQKFVGPAKKKKKKRDQDKDIEVTGLKIDQIPEKERKKYRLDKKTGIVYQKAWKELIELVDRKFNPDSPAQVKAVLGNKGYTIPTFRGKQSTDAASLKKMRLKYPNEGLIKHLLAYSSVAILKKHFLKLRLDDDRFKFSMSMGGTKTGRFGSGDTPWGTGRNIQNIPSGRKSKIELKQIFIPDPMMTFIQVDLSQAELHIVAWLSEDKLLIEMLEDKQDVHQFAVDKIGKMIGRTLPRYVGKPINYGTNYGMGGYMLAASILKETDFVLTVPEATVAIETRMKTFPGIPRWQNMVRDKLIKDLTLVNPFGRRRRFFGRLYADYGSRRLDKKLFYDALSYLPQSTVADALNEAWMRLEEQCMSYGDLQVMQQGHDSLLIQVNKTRVSEAVDLLNKVFSSVKINIHEIDRVIPHDITVGDNWRDLRSYK